MSRSPLLATCLAALLLLAAGPAANAAPQYTCSDAERQNPEIAARTADLQRSPTQLGKRLELAKLLETAGCSADAVRVLEDGKKYNPYNPTLLFSLRRARERLEQEHYYASLGQAESSARSNAKATATAHKLRALQSQRQALLKRCTDGDGDAALQACKSVLTKGAPNEFDLTVRIALLQQRGNQTSQALDSYIAADSLRHGDKGVALAILALLQSTQRKDAVALAGKGSALITVGHAHDGLVVLRQAKALEPELPDIDQQIRAAEAAARMEAGLRKEKLNQMTAVDAKAASEAVAETTPEPPRYSNVAEVTRSN